MKQIIITLTALLLTACSNPERINPFDPAGKSYHPPVVTINAKDTTPIRDTVILSAIVTDSAKGISRYRWISGKDTVTTVTPVCRFSWRTGGMYPVSVTAVDLNGVRSVSPAVCSVMVKTMAPTTTASAPLKIGLKDTLTLKAVFSDSNGTIISRTWTCEGAVVSTSADSLRLAFKTAGIKKVLAQCMDDDSVFSNIDTIQVTVTEDAPVVAAQKDTSVEQNDTLVLKTSAKDNGKILGYYWSVDGSSFTAGSDSLKTVFKTAGVKSVLVKCLDDDSLFSNIDTIKVAVSLPIYTLTGETTKGGTIAPLGNVSVVWGNAQKFIFHADNGYKLDSVTVNGVKTTADTLITLSNITSGGTVKAWYSVNQATLVTPAMVQIPGGSFTMGGSWASTQPHHQVTLSRFKIGKYEVTQAEYELLMGKNPSNNKNTNKPVETVSWFDAVLYCNALSKIEGKDTVYSYSAKNGENPCTGLDQLKTDFTKEGYRLPTEAEWEYACRAGTAAEYFWGDDTSYGEINKYAVYQRNSKDLGQLSSEFGPHIVGQKLPNAFGLYDMSGNVWEWCNDLYAPYSSETVINPTGPSSGTNRILRGGSWELNLIQSGLRVYLSPTHHSEYGGFRVVLGVPAVTSTFNVTSETTSGGTISPMGQTVLFPGDAQKFSFHADSGYKLDSVTVGGVKTSIDYGSDISAAIKNISSNQTIKAWYSPLVPISPTMVKIPGGSFMRLGEDSGKVITISSFQMGKYEITQSEYESVIGVNKSTMLGPKKPMTYITWFDMVLYCNALSRKEGKDTVYNYSRQTGLNPCTALTDLVIDYSKNGYRLPTEAEWEYACRGGKQYEFGTDDGTINLSNVNFKSKVMMDVGSYPPNPFGVHDMSGNVYEWCNDWYSAYSEAPESDNPKGAKTGWSRVLRGGGWGDSDVRARDRNATGPETIVGSIGFRVICR